MERARYVERDEKREQNIKREKETRTERKR